MSIDWNESYAVGVKDIDDQHKELFSRVNALIDAMMQKKGGEEIGKVVKFLESYVIAHFGNEERQMTRNNYPGLANHKGQHEAFIKAFNEIKKQYQEKGPVSEVTIQINSKLGSWLRSHIPVIDKELGKFLNSLKN